ncbi:cbb3-type cytochrome c oxidase N-terminal domain-containing protein [Spirosoma pollinicola]|uniref:Cytochrome C n=1 Tax=Spirosoma pollinicola TaxID=2057025 RepID=A0A2K8Z365_9BACT|nr:cbb3-type cytochrome c oxidase N-terminal domain-containing protein [Spirosoma pollinicola]AUD04264.1 cytochrome C [Spirosoma pollinicola]
MNLVILFTSGLLALEPTPSMWTVSSGQDLLIIMLALILLAGMVVVGFVALYMFLVLKKVLAPEVVDQVVSHKTFLQQITGMKPLEQEHELVMEHAYDGIAELDNPTPPWFMWLFYSSIIFAVIYMVSYHIIGDGKVMVNEYTQEMAIADKAREEYISKVAGSINENTVTLMKDAKAVDAGKTLFAQYCVACHGASAEGKVGPNLTDPFWLHGGNVKAVFHTITEGVPEKGMISWKKQLNPLQVQQVASYILSLQGSNPAGAKEPQGEKEAGAAPVAMR